ncbi:MAG: hypothetical protein ACOC1F_01345, partial [Myxococcota bacterium]
GTLSGRMSAFAEVGASPFDYEAEKNTFSWRGLHDTSLLWQLESDPVYLAAFTNDAWKTWAALKASQSQTQ